MVCKEDFVPYINMAAASMNAAIKNAATNMAQQWKREDFIKEAREKGTHELPPVPTHEDLYWINSDSPQKQGFLWFCDVLELDPIDTRIAVYNLAVKEYKTLKDTLVLGENAKIIQAILPTLPQEITLEDVVKAVEDKGFNSNKVYSLMKEAKRYRWIKPERYKSQGTRTTIYTNFLAPTEESNKDTEDE